MSVSWKQYEGHVINDTFPLLRHLGGSEQSVVFLTQLAGPQSSNAVIKLIPESPSGELQLSLWRRAAQVTHPNVLPLYQGGRCRLANFDVLYVVMEYAEEDLSQILPQRRLSPAEVRDMLGPVLEALSDLHGQGLVHCHLKPSNILATADQVKLSSDRLSLAGASRIYPGNMDMYEAPESASQPLTPACDVWSLGMTIVEVLTQQPALWQLGSQADPLVPKTLPHPFLDIAQNSLRQDPGLRCTLAEIRDILNPATAAVAAAAQSVAPLSVPLSPVAAVPAAKLRPPRPAPPVAKAPYPRPAAPITKAPYQRSEKADEPESIVLPSYVVPLVAAVLILAAVIALPKILGKRAENSSSASTSTATSATGAQSPEQPGRQEASRSGKPNSSSANRDSAKGVAGKQPAKVESVAPAASAAPAALRTQTKTATDLPKSSSTGSPHGEVLDQVLPDVSQEALATIRGTVRVTVRLHVDAAGNVSNAELADRGPSPFFADLALRAARLWEFTSPDGKGHSVPSEWQVRFEFSPSGVKAFPAQTSP